MQTAVIVPPHGTLPPASLCNGHACVQNPCTGSMHETTNPSSIVARMFPSYLIKSRFPLQTEREKAYSQFTNMVKVNSWNMSLKGVNRRERQTYPVTLPISIC